MYPSSSKIVETIHTLRGEHYRRMQNQKRLPLNLKTSKLTQLQGGSTLPADLLSDSVYSKERPPIPTLDTRQALFVPKRVDRPRHDLTSTSTGRAELLSFILPTVAEYPKVPPLTLLCLQIIRSSSDADFFETILPFIPPHLRNDLLRWTAIHSPLTAQQLRSLCGSEGHVAGELIIMGPNGSLRDDHFESPETSRSVEWESDERLATVPMQTCILVSVQLTLYSLRTLPPTLTRLALIDVLAPVSLQRLPTTCPLLEHLDLSYNTWLVTEKDSRERLDKVQWSRWHHLRELGARGCHIPADIVDDMNKNRWDDVKVVQ
ncbi:hypothetical protein B0H11DRAFT_2263068 [Mycena galericulata]|nr:hypothetical protein B0H11DRAFT_2263068 [Mycena galericulata]